MSNPGEERAEEGQGKRNKAFVLRLPEALYGQLEEWAAQDLRSVNSLIVKILRDAAKQHEDEYTEEQQNAELLEAA